MAFWRFAAFVAVIEYFTRHRMVAIILSGFGRVLGILAGYAILAKPFHDSRDVSTVYLVCQTKACTTVLKNKAIIAYIYTRVREEIISRSFTKSTDISTLTATKKLRVAEHMK